MIESASRFKSLGFYPKSRSLAQPCSAWHAFSMRQLILDLLPENPPSLANFIPGANLETRAALAGWMGGKAREPFMFLWGESGSGKTHLLRACAAEYIDASDDPDLHGLKDPDGRARDGVAVDNVEALDTEGQIALFDLINHFRAEGHRLLAAASLPPFRLSALREDLRTRLGSALIFQMHVLSDEEKTQALAGQAEARGLALPPGSLEYLLSRMPRDMRSLMGFLVALDRYSLEHKRPITLPLLREVLQHASF